MPYANNFLLITALLASFVLAAPKEAIANNDTEWKAAYAEWQKSNQDKKLTDTETCQSIWDFFWPWAKRGNLEARAYFYLMLALPGDWAIRTPIDVSDFASRIRTIIILQIHSAGVQYDETIDEDTKSLYPDLAEFYEKQIEVWDGMKGGTYMPCIKEASTKESAQRCAQIAVQEKLVPSFEDFAAEVDALIAQGLRLTCKDLPQKKGLR